MNMIKDFQCVLDYIEQHIEQPIDFSEIANQMYISSYYFQKIFSAVCGMGVGEYIRNRRLSLAGSELANSDKKIIDVALKYGYDTPEGFTRAFTRFHGASPTAIKKGMAFPKSFEKLSVIITVKGGSSMNYRIEKKASFKVAEKRESHKIYNSENINTIPEFWERSHSDGTVAKLLEITNDRSFIFGICYSNSHKKDVCFDYSIAVKIDDETKVPEGFEINEIPQRTWLVFECVGAMPDAVQQTFHKICTEFFPTSEYQPTYEFDIEAYTAGAMNDKNYRSEIWIPIEEKV